MDADITKQGRLDHALALIASLKRTTNVMNAANHASQAGEGHPSGDLRSQDCNDSKHLETHFDWKIRASIEYGHEEVEGALSNVSRSSGVVRMSEGGFGALCEGAIVSGTQELLQVSALV